MTILLQHTFTAPNNSTVLPTADTGQLTESLSGNFGIENNKAYYVGGGTALSVWDATQSNVKVSVDTVAASGTNYPGVSFRLSDASNYWLFRNGNSTLQLYKFENGSATLIASKGFVFSGGISYKMEVVVNGSTIECYIDGVLQLSTVNSFNQSATKFGLRQHYVTNDRYDNLIVESLGTTDPGTDGTTAFDSRQSIYEASFTTADTRQIAYADGTLTTDLRQLLYVDQAQATDTHIAIYQEGATAQDTAQVLYEMSAVAFDTLQELFNDGQVGATPFDVRVQLYDDASAEYDTRQAVYDGGLLRYDVAQVIYESNATVVDVKAVIYADSAINTDVVQSIYADGEFDADTLQRILAEFSEYSEVVRIVLEITQRRREALEITQQAGSDLEIVQRRVIELNL